eukprot:s3579_g15.t2
MAADGAERLCSLKLAKKNERASFSAGSIQELPRKKGIDELRSQQQIGFLRNVVRVTRAICQRKVQLFARQLLHPLPHCIFKRFKPPSSVGEKMADTSMLEALATSNDWRVRYETFLKFRQLGPKVIAQQAEALEGFSRSRYPWMRKLALEAMAVMEPQDRHIGMLHFLLKDTDDDVCYEALAIRTMKRLQPDILEKHAEILSRLLGDEDWNVRLAALSTLARLDPLKLCFHSEAIKERCTDEVHQVAELAQKVWTRLNELPHRVVTCRREDSCSEEVRITCTSMAGNELTVVSILQAATCEELRQCVAKTLSVPLLQLKLLSSESQPQELVGQDMLPEEMHLNDELELEVRLISGKLLAKVHCFRSEGFIKLRQRVKEACQIKGPFWLLQNQHLLRSPSPGQPDPVQTFEVNASLVLVKRSVSDLSQELVGFEGAAFRGDAQEVFHLLDEGAEIDYRDTTRLRTPLMWAATGGHSSLCLELLKRGANPKLRASGRPERAVLGRGRSLFAEIIKDELTRIASGRPSTGRTSRSLRSTALSKPSLEAKNKESEPSDFIKECLALQAVRDAQGVPPLKRSSCRSSPSLHEPPFVVKLRKHGEFTRKIMCPRGVGGVLQKTPPPWSNETSTAPVLPSKYRELSWWLWASVNPEYQIYPEVVELRRAYPWHKGANAAQLAQGNDHEELAQTLEREMERHDSIDGGYYMAWQLKRAATGAQTFYREQVVRFAPMMDALFLLLLVLTEVCRITCPAYSGLAFFIVGVYMTHMVPKYVASFNPYVKLPRLRRKSKSVVAPLPDPTG